jgi:hypothetical protein
MGRWGESMRFGGTVDMREGHFASDKTEGAFLMSRGSGRVRGFLLYVPDLYEGRMHVSAMEGYLFDILLFTP